jgi:hypothetical protein
LPRAEERFLAPRRRFFRRRAIREEARRAERGTLEERMRVQFVPRENGPEKLVCDAEIVFGPECGALAGTKLVGFSLWRGTEDQVSVTFPARAFGVGHERKYYDYLRAVQPGTAETKKVKDWILEEFRAASRAA